MSHHHGLEASILFRMGAHAYLAARTIQNTLFMPNSFRPCPSVCLQNRVSAGFIMARLKFQITSANGQTSVTTFLAPSLTYPTYTPSPTASTTSSVLHMYQSFIAPPTLTPGQMTKSAETTFSLPITYGNSWTVTKVNTGGSRAYVPCPCCAVREWAPRASQSSFANKARLV